MIRKFIGSIIVLLMVCFLDGTSTSAESFKQKLVDDWSFFEQQFITSAKEGNEGINVQIPIEFDDITGEVSTYGTFIKTVSISKRDQSLGLLVPFTYSAAKIYIDGKLYEEVGKVGKSSIQHENDLKTVVIPFEAATDNVEIVIQISSFNHIRGGFSEAPVVGDWATIHKDFTTQRYVDVFIIGIIMVVGLLALLIGVQKRDEKIMLTFGLFALVVALRGFFAVPFLYHDLPIDLSYEFATRMEYITTNVCFILYAIFSYLLYNKLYSKFVLYPVLSILFVLTLLSIFANPVTFQQMFFNAFIFMMIFVMYNIWIIVRAFRSNLQLAKPLLLGVLLVFIGLVVDFLAGMGFIYAPPLANFMIAANVVIVLVSVSRNYVKQLHLVTELNTSLDEIVKTRTQELHAANEELTRFVNIDALTGSYNRRKFNEAIVTAFDESQAQNRSLGLLMIDIDDFKKYNDFYGHVTGDELLKRVVEQMKQLIPSQSLLARYGGEEFVVILPEFDKEACLQIAEQLRIDIERAQIEHAGTDNGFLTLSIGCSERIDDQLSSVKEIIHVADARLYVSKTTGRNQTTAF